MVIIERSLPTSLIPIVPILIQFIPSINTKKFKVIRNKISPTLSLPMCTSFLLYLPKQHIMFGNLTSPIQPTWPSQHKHLSMIILDMDSTLNLLNSAADARCCCHCSYLVIPRIVLTQWLGQMPYIGSLKGPCFCPIHQYSQHSCLINSLPSSHQQSTFNKDCKFQTAKNSRSFSQPTPDIFQDLTIRRYH